MCFHVLLHHQFGVKKWDVNTEGCREEKLEHIQEVEDGEGEGEEGVKEKEN